MITAPLGRRTYPFLDHDGPIAFAHRGGARDRPENTMAAFEWAVSLGYRYFETDVRRTLDGALVAFHDHSLDRLTDRPGKIADLRWEEVRTARVQGEPIPLLEDILGTWPEVRVNIDPKQTAAVVPLVEVLRRTGAFDRVCVAAFSDRRLLAVRRLTGGRVCTSTGPAEIARLRMASLGVPAGLVRAACVQVPRNFARRPLVDQRFVDAAHRAGLPVHVWTINDRSEMEELLDLGVDGLMTDRLEVLKQVLIDRSAWI